MRVGLVAAGPKQYLPKLSEIKGIDYWIGIDAGTLYLLEEGIVVHQAIGDFDSVTKEEWEYIKKNVDNIKLYPTEKDETDTEIAINQAIMDGATSLFHFGMTGGRLDHMMANIQLLTKWKKLNPRIEAIIMDKNNWISIYLPGMYKLSKDGWKYTSFFSMSEQVENLSLEKFKYNLTNYNLLLGSTLCTSNEIVNEFSYFSFTAGILLVVRSND